MAKPASYLTFKAVSKPGRKTRSFNVVNTRDQLLGTIGWFSHWRRYCYCPASGIVLDAACLREIANFCVKLMMERDRG